jgi:shikimate dehydrogenase
VKRAFVIGHPIAHSRSPLIHGHWLNEHALDGSYEAIDVAPEEFPAFFDRLRTGEFVGGNVTVPHKEMAFEYCDTRDFDTAHIGAFNTLIVRKGRDNLEIHGTNTDHYGFLANLDEHARGWSEGLLKAVVLGAGGAARGVASALMARGIPRVIVMNRTPEKAEALAGDMAGPLEARPMSDWKLLAPTTRFVVNTTTVGMHGTKFDDLNLGLLPKDALVTDIVYTPLETPLLAEARLRNLRTVDGLGMLLHQAVPGFEAWFGVRPEVTAELRQKVEATIGAS